MILDLLWKQYRWWSVALIVTLLIGLFLVGGYTVEALVIAARWATGGHLGAMAVIGWLFWFAPFGLLWAVLLRGPDSVVCLGLLILLTPATLACFPGGYNETLAEAITGPGGAAFVAGARNGALGGLIPTVVVPFVVFNESLRARFDDRTLRLMMVAPVATVLIATMIAAVVLAP
ncbi:hypothetical protein [Actinoplanes couchii]|uniref:Uncharacterized protein n=1 Tax=Actinoplanes couchii TaxID=403638 RepID=A0ABQ3XC22_9ACTN|nr:hypothetical protein [Actinoplanes couchii]MDR6323498.1 hypothetical protein [Actinoplanes couchii]GID56015.1 hypothetical protein Aco03nite_044190 [Actinoplanes couchii]